MSVAIMALNRRKIESVDMIGASIEEKVALAETYFSYCSKYKVSEDKVTHIVEVSFYPNPMEENQERLEKFEDKLILSTQPIIVEGKQQINYIIWKKIK
ncbi:MAG: hypothetical protein QG670_889 [Thermoproteota archaeon]|nr:hypothetical protein [Thermoproteota archaeon]